MTAYNVKPILFPSLVVQEAKEKRRRVLQGVWKRRRLIYQRFMQKKRHL
jgi:hypothetical protein